MEKRSEIGRILTKSVVIVVGIVLAYLVPNSGRKQNIITEEGCISSGARLIHNSSTVICPICDAH